MNQDSPGMKSAPHSLEAEQAVLGGLLMDNTALDAVADVTAEADFYSLDHRKIFRAIFRQLEANKAADAVTVAEFLDRHGELEASGGLPYLVSLVTNTPSVANIKRYAEIVRDRAISRRLIAALAESEERAYTPQGMTTREVLDYAQARVLGVSESARSGQGGPAHVGLVMDSVLRAVDEMASRSASDVTGLATGFSEFDKLTTGLHPGQLIILAGRPSMGKTALALNIAEHVALKEGKRVLFFSLEMVNNELGARLVSSVSRLPQQRVKIGRLNESEFKRMYEAASILRDKQIYLDEEGTLSALEMRARCRRVHRESGGLHLIVVDYLQLMQTSGKSDNRANEVAELSRALKQLAKELQVPVVALSQLNRGLEARPNKRPIMSDLRDSGGIEQDADLIMFIYRDEVYHDDSPDKGIAEIIVAKQRNGPTGTVYVNFVGELIRFDDRHKQAPIPSHVERHDRATRRKAAQPVRGKDLSYADM